jgi:hypothetical protein
LKELSTYNGKRGAFPYKRNNKILQIDQRSREADKMKKEAMAL